MATLVHIRAHQPWFRIPWHEIVEYRDLFWLLVKRDLTAVYKQTILGPLWFVIGPLMTTVVFTVVFDRVAAIGTDGLPAFLFYMCGTVFWNYFLACLNGASNALVANAGVFGKVYFPRLIVPFSAAITGLAHLILGLAMLGGFYIYFVLHGVTVRPSPWLLALPLLVLQSLGAGLGAGLWMTSLTAKYRDLRFALPIIAQLWMYATPIVYPASKVPEAWRWIWCLNPMVPVVESARLALLGQGSVTPAMLAVGGISAALLFFSGVLVFNRVQRTFVDTV